MCEAGLRACPHFDSLGRTDCIMAITNQDLASLWTAFSKVIDAEVALQLAIHEVAHHRAEVKTISKPAKVKRKARDKLNALMDELRVKAA